MKNIYCLVGKQTKDLLSYQGRVIVHWDKEELEFLVPGVEVRRLNMMPPNFLHLSEHPAIKGRFSFPIDKDEF